MDDRALNLTETEQTLPGKRAIIESVNDELKNIYKLQHTRLRSLNGLSVYNLS